MGIDFRYRIEPDDIPNVGCSYSNFARLRRSLASLVGIDLASMDGFYRGDGTCVSWDAFASEPLVPFLNHSDCDGELSPCDCAKVAARLRELIPRIDDEYHVEICTGLADMMDECVRHHVPLEFR